MSFLREIIASAEEIEIKNIKLRVPELRSELHLFKAEILKYLDEIYVEYLRKPAEIPQSSYKLTSLEEELNLIKASLQHQNKKELVCEDVWNNINEYVQEIDVILLELKELCFIHEKIIDMKLYFSTQNYSEALKILKEVESIIKNSQSEVILKYFCKTIALEKSSMFVQFGELINTTFLISVKDQGNTSYLKFENNSEVNDLIQHLYKYNNHIRMLNKLIDFLWEFIFVSIITCIVKVTINDHELSLTVIKRHCKQNYSDIFNKLYRVNYFLQSFLNLVLSDSNNITLLEYIGNQLKDKFSPLLISHCLKKIHPPDEGDAIDYEKIIEDTEKLLYELKFLRIISDSSILEYARGLKQIHVNRRCDIFLNNAKMLMNRKSSEISQVGTPFPNNDVNDMSDFPSMSISSVAQELLQLIEKILMEMKSSSLTSGTILFQSVLAILYYYMKNGGRYQEEMMAEQVAIFHNNCKYIAHEVEEWNIFYADIFQKDINIPLFKNEVFQLQIIADEALHIFVNKEKNKLKNFLSRCDMENTDRPEGLFATPMRQCFNQIRYLKEAWRNILSHVVYNKSMGVLFNTICNYFIELILKGEGFDTNTQQKLSEIFNFIIKKSPSYFIELDLKNFVHCWEKFTSIYFVLISNLTEIETNWSSKESFLKSNLKTNEIKVLIKTFFEDSPKTTMVLSKLHD